jgi:hypothetical protein
MSKWSAISSFVATASVVQEFPIQTLPVSNYIHRVFVCTILSGKTTLLIQFYLAQYNFIKVGIPISALYCPSSLFLITWLFPVARPTGYLYMSMNPWQHHRFIEPCKVSTIPWQTREDLLIYVEAWVSIFLSIPTPNVKVFINSLVFLCWSEEILNIRSPCATSKSSFMVYSTEIITHHVFLWWLSTFIFA